MTLSDATLYDKLWIVMYILFSFFSLVQKHFMEELKT